MSSERPTDLDELRDCCQTTYGSAHAPDCARGASPRPLNPPPPRCCIPFTMTGKRHSLLCPTNTVPLPSLPYDGDAQFTLEARAAARVRAGLATATNLEDWSPEQTTVERISDWVPEPGASFMPSFWTCCGQRAVQGHAPWCVAQPKLRKPPTPLEHAW
jgi:hypothetical protein